MPTLRKPNPIAIVVSDIHLTLLQPACRADKDWMAVQAEYLQQLKDAATNAGPWPLPILCAGDIFDRWNPSPELINFALRHLPDEMICVPGQHDLPNHRIDLMHRSGYGVLKEVKKIRDISGTTTGNMGRFSVHGFGWGQGIEPAQRVEKFLRVALIHRYVWTEDKKYPGAPPTANISALKKDLVGYDVAVTGDNHIGFLGAAGDCQIINVGGFIRRKSDEIDYQPGIGIIFDDSTVKRVRLDTIIDKFHPAAQGRKEVPFNMKEFIEGLEGLGEHGLDFRQAVENHLRTNEVHPRTKEIIIKAMET